MAGDRVSAATRELMLQHPAFTRFGWGSGDASITEDQQPAVTGNADRALQIEGGRDEQAAGDEPTADMVHREPTGSTVAVEATATESENSSDPSTDRSEASRPEPFGDPDRSSEDRAEPDAVPQQIAPQSDTPVLPHLSPLPEQTERSSSTDARWQGHADGGVQEVPAGHETVEHGDDAEDPTARAKIAEQSIEIGREVVQPAGRAADESEGLSLAAIDPAPSASPDVRLERSLTSEDGDQLTTDVSVTTEDEAQRRYELGYDPAVKQFRPGETETALRIESERGVQLERAKSADEKYDWVDSDGRTYDAIGNFPAKFLDRQWDNLKEKVEHHLEKADFVPIDVAKFTPEQCQRIRETFAVYYPRVFIVGDDGFDGRND
ncbi:hypothetical protein GCM10029976_067100 [Kribbella albertanoniae]|uniref:hypothetical protein n=1 Tax=Kribbella albertanoniae TaxID=1266829 RepID=UPI001EE14CD8|nr:hypothetical protein [Kribbella albertanoniae]